MDVNWFASWRPLVRPTRPLVPLPVMFMGLLVCVVQTVVFVMLSTVYLSMATAGHGDEAHGH